MVLVIDRNRDSFSRTLVRLLLRFDTKMLWPCIGSYRLGNMSLILPLEKDGEIA